jgi:hypothetical protein
MRHFVGLVLVGLAAASVERPWMDKRLPSEDRAQKLLDEMTQEEKISMVSPPTWWSWWYMGTAVNPVERPRYNDKILTKSP